ncbi:unnamed protein product [Porites lobata]|uniref:NACHT domain-containing protein n=1 Tax=Porites lobata TaxID=104759 RepID=A0ABN8RUM9_9CNID|nr:unnamed protein product [Porites lobata]
MATATPSPLASSVEKTNGNKLSRLLIDGGTTVLRNIFDSHHPRANLAAKLSSTHIHPILTRLRHRNILNGVQWDKLFPPPGGGPPNSKNFDITLLFLLLRNICGLHPPLSGWDRMPPASDTSFEANLARIKYYRNVLYGHVTTTGIQTPVFDVKWQAVSSVLVSLGLSQSEVDRLKREPCGEDYVSAVIEWMKNDEEIQFQLKDLRTKQQQVLQTQQEDHRTLHDTHKIVGKVQQTQIEASNLQQQDHKTLQDTHQAVGNLQQMLHEVRRTQQESQQLFKYEAANAEERRDKAEEDEALRKLAQVNTERVIQYHSGKYQEGTRLHIFEKIKLWLDDLASENRVIVISGDAGMGKSVIAAVVCQRMQHAGRLSGSHFCQHNKERYRNPKVMLQSLACQLCDVLPEYKSELLKKLSRNLGVDMDSLEVQELFEFLFEEPLCTVGDPGRNLLLAIDGLDESEYKGRNDLLDVVANHFCKLPAWFRFLVTTRPEVNIADRLKKFNPIQLEQDNEENVKDIRLFLEKQLSSVIQAGFKEVIIDALVRKAAGHFLYAYLMVDFIRENVSLLTPEELGRTLPSGVSSVYQSYFERLEKELKIGEDQFLTFLSALAAAREPLPRDFVSKMLLSDSKSLSGPRKVTKAINSISTLLPVHDDCIVFFHKSVKDWLIDRTGYGRHHFSVDEKQGHAMLSQLCTNELNNVKRKGVHGTEFSNTARYALQHGVYHMLESEEVAESPRSFEEIVNNYVTDLDIVSAKLCVNNTASCKDIILTQKQEAFQSLSSESRKALGTLLSLLRKYHGRLSTHPSTIFQVMVNEGEDVFAGEATKALQSRKIAYMEYLHKEAVKESNETQAEFPCNSMVACFDVSATQEFMVCECNDGMIYLWSLETGEQRWVRPVEVRKRYLACFFPLRAVPSSSVFSCYRSVVFHPTEPVVLPGILSHAYSFEGNLQPLFPRSNCRFSVCSVHGDESKIITDCPGDAKCLVMWNLKNGEEITRTIRNEDVLSFAWSPDGTLLAISHCSGLVCLVDALNGLETLAEVATSQPCGMIKFTPDIQFLFCSSLSFPLLDPGPNLSFRLNIIKLPCGTFSFNVDDPVNNPVYDPVDPVDDPRNYEASSKGGFLMGDPMFFFSSRVYGFAFVLNKQSELRVLYQDSNIKMLNCGKRDDLRLNRRFPFIFPIAFALDGKTIYGTFKWQKDIKVVCLDVSSGERKAEKRISTRDVLLVPVSEGVLLKESKPGADVQLWNFELSQQIRSWPNLSEVTDIMPVSDQCVACVDFEVSILDTSNGNIVKTIPLWYQGVQLASRFRIEAILCNSKYQLLFTIVTRGGLKHFRSSSLQLSDGENVLWNTSLTFARRRGLKEGIPGMFSPTEEFVLISASDEIEQTVIVFQASSGKSLRTLCTVRKVLGCAFVSKTECVIVCMNTSGRYCLPLFNVSTGDFLTVLDINFVPSQCLASCPQEGLIAIGHEHTNMCTVIEVKLPRDKGNREAKVSESSTLGDKGCATVLRLGNEFGGSPSTFV